MDYTHFLKNTLKRLLERHGISVSRTDENLFDIVLRATLNNGGSVIQVGANDGVSNDPIREYLFDFDGQVFLIEPQPDAFDRLHKNWAPAPSNVNLINCALTEMDGRIVMYRIAPAKITQYRKLYRRYANASGITSLKRSHVENFLIKVAGSSIPQNEISNWISTIEVDGISVSNFIERYKIEKVALLQIDAEGQDFVILNQFPDAGIVPNVVNFEIKNLAVSDQNEIVKRLLQLSYTTYKHKGDMLAFKPINLG